MKVIFYVLQYFIVFCVSSSKSLSTTDVITNTITTTVTVPDSSYLIDTKDVMPRNLSIHNVTLDEETNSYNLTLTWVYPYQPNGSIKYIDILVLGYYSLDENLTDSRNFSVNVDEKGNYSLPIAKLWPSSNYSFSVPALSHNATGNASIVHYVTNDTQGIPRNLSISDVTIDNETNSYNLTLTWAYPYQPIGSMRCFHISVIGHYSLDGNLTDSRNLTVKVGKNWNYSHQIAKLWPSSEYSFSVSALSHNATGNASIVYYATDDTLAGPPTVNVSIIDDHLQITWAPSEQKFGKIEKYLLNIEGIPLYDQRTACPPLPKFSKTFNNNTSSFLYLIPQAYYFNYNISVLVENSAGYGKKGYANISMPKGVPEKPDNLTVTANETSISISWLIPCLLNGDMDYFNISISKFYTEEPLIKDIHDEKVKFEKGKYFYVLLDQIDYSFNYTVSVEVVLKSGIRGEEATYSFITPDGLPDAPIITNTTNSNTSFEIHWEPPKQKSGKIQKYTIEVTSLGPAYATPNRCKTMFDMNITYPSKCVDGSERLFLFNKAHPFFKYTVVVTAHTTKGGGDSALVYLITKPSVPQNAYNISVNDLWVGEDEDYNGQANITFETPCFLNGPLWEFRISYFGMRSHYPNITFNGTAVSPYILLLKPEYMYQFNVTTVTRFYENTSDIVTFRSPPGVPKFSVTPETLPISLGTSTAEVTLRKGYFNDSNGEIKYISLIISDRNVTGGEIQYWNETNWPAVQSSEANLYYQISDDWWNPFNETDKITFEIGSNHNCKKLNCNEPLEENKEYYLILRMFTSRFYRNSPTIYFRTDKFSHLGAILGIIFGILIGAVLGLAAFFVWKKRILVFPKTIYSRKSSVKSVTQPHTSIQVGKFLNYFKLLENNPEKFREQFLAMDEKTKKILEDQTFVYSVLTENKRKNRYVNILPYDDTRVKLLIDEDDEIGSDYINASYIKGYTGQVEYIATQGPLPSTCRDFWKMVLQENVTIIVMVSQFIENSREKCFKYFPKNQSTMIIGEDMEVKCSTEVDFGPYCLRSIQVKRDNTEVTVTHMQYLEWPDFGVPQGTDHMLQFCTQIRQRIKMNKGYMIVHCSAGVGRTGTIIATDILLQCVNAGKDIDIFNAILELRKQRSHMVQTEKQYIYIHSLIKDFIERPPTPDLIENMDPIYENICTIKDHSDDEDLKIETEESAF